MHAGIIIPSLNHSSSIDSNSTHYSTFASVCSLTRHRFTPLDYNTVGIIAAILFAGISAFDSIASLVHTELAPNQV